MFAAAIPISGGGDPALAQNMTDVPVSGSRDMIEAIEDARGEPRYTEYPEDRHSIWEKVTETPGLLDWLFARERD